MPSQTNTQWCAEYRGTLWSSSPSAASFDQHSTGTDKASPLSKPRRLRIVARQDCRGRNSIEQQNFSTSGAQGQSWDHPQNSPDGYQSAGSGDATGEKSGFYRLYWADTVSGDRETRAAAFQDSQPSERARKRSHQICHRQGSLVQVLTINRYFGLSGLTSGTAGDFTR